MEPPDIAAIAAAVIALVGVVITLAISENRARRESRVSREDSYRLQVRTRIADLLVAAHAFQRCGTALADPANWLSEGKDRLLELSQQVTEATAGVERALVVAELTVVDTGIQQCLGDLRVKLEDVEEIRREVVGSFWERRRASPITKDRDIRWQAYQAACEHLQSVSLNALRPTVREIAR